MKKNPYKLFQSQNIVNYHSTVIEICKNVNNMVSLDKNYNFFSLTSSSWVMFKLYKELHYYIRTYINDMINPLWIQSWLTYHTEENTPLNLTQKSQSTEYYGNICINPQDTYTLFDKKTKLQNKIGQIFLKKGNNSELKIQPNKLYKDSYIAIEFNITSDSDKFLGTHNFYPLV